MQRKKKLRQGKVYSPSHQKGIITLFFYPTETEFRGKPHAKQQATLAATARTHAHQQRDDKCTAKLLKVLSPSALCRRMDDTEHLYSGAPTCAMGQSLEPFTAIPTSPPKTQN